MFRLKIFYIKFLGKKNKNIFELILYFFLYILSFVYGFFVNIRNFLYDYKIIKPFKSDKKIISIGNISLGGSGKTTFSIYLYNILSKKFNVAIIRRGYGEDETKLLFKLTKNVFCLPDRVKLIKNLNDFDIFILDDGFQYRKISKDIDIVIITDRELKEKIRLLPVSLFREGFSSLKRADFLIINYADYIDKLKIKNFLLNKFPHIKIYFSNYRFKSFVDLENNKIDLEFLRSKKLAIFTAIGYPEGFIRKINELSLNVFSTFIYPDHYNLSIDEFKKIEKELIEKNIDYLVITEKDRFHIPEVKSKINIIVFVVELIVEEEDNFLKEVFRRLKCF